MKRSSLDSLPPAEAIRTLGLLIDLSGELERQEGIDRALAWCTALLERKLRKPQRALLHYFAANAWETRRLLSRTGWDTRDWGQSEFEAEIMHLRQALKLGSPRVLSELRQAQILSNLGNVFSHIGRLVEAIEYWTRGMAVAKRVGMAQANRGYGLLQYSDMVHETHQAHVLVYHGYWDLKNALRLRLGVHAVDTFRTMLAEAEKKYPPGWLSRCDDAPDSRLGKSKAEQHYRQWCLDRDLFLSPLNDVGPLRAAAHDTLVLPGVVRSIGSPMAYEGLFNQMKQEYASARYLLYEGLTSDEVHFSDRGVRLVDTFDWPAYSLAVEKAKAAFRMAYSIFDKIAFWLNHYYSLGLKPEKISFKGVWYVPSGTPGRLRPELHKPYNYPLQGLFWLQKDLFEKDVRFTAPIEPDARKLHEIRNQLEHKYLKLHVELRRPEGVAPPATTSLEVDPLCYSLQRDDFERKALRMFRLVRAALIYLYQSTYIEEGHRAAAKPDRKVADLGAFEYEDRLKI